MKVVIFGSRSVDRLEEVEKAMEESGVSATEIVSGCATGVDTLALAYAEKHNLPVKLFPARWEKFGDQACPLRNIEMAAYADFGVAVWDGQSPGTAHMIGLMEGRVFVWHVDDVDDAEKLVITAPEQVARLKAIYENCGPGAEDLAWDFSRPDRVVLPKEKAQGGQGRLTNLDLRPYGWPRPWPEALLAALASADFDIHLMAPICDEESCNEPDSGPEGEESQEETAANPAGGREAAGAANPGPPAPAKDRYEKWDQVTYPADVEILKFFYEASGLERALEESSNFDAELLADPFRNWIFLESGAVVGRGIEVEEGRLTALYLAKLKDEAVIKKLKRLDLLAGLTALRELSLDLGWLEDKQVLAGPPSLEKLYLYGRRIEELPPFSGLVNLKKLQLSRLNLKSLAPLANLTALEELDLSDNSIQDLGPLAGLTSLKRLDLRLNRISELTPLAGLAALEELELDYNRFMAIGPLNLVPLCRLTGLKILSLRDNQVPPPALLAGLTALEKLDLQGCRIRDLALLAGLTGLKELGLGDNQIRDLGPLAGLTALEELHLHGNLIRDLSPLASLASLKWLDLRENEISDLRPLAGLTALEKLCLEDNHIGDLAPLAGLTALRGLDVSHNLLTDLKPLAGLTALTELTLKANQIIDLSPLAGLDSLTSLDLARNLIEDLGPLARLSALEDLNLADNRISDLWPLAALSALEELDLENNEITVPPDLPGLLTPYTLRLGGNPLRDIRALEKICRGSAGYISLGRGRPANKTKPASSGPEATPREPTRRKLLILDLDGTLWGGMAADGNIVFGPGCGRYGLAYLAFQRQIKALARAGLLLAVCSLNDLHIARRPFLTRDDLPLALEDFAAFKANWRAKADNILDISRELGLPLNEMVFVDNEREQRTEIRRRLPEVAVPELPDEPGRYIQALKRGGWLNNYFDAAGLVGGKEDELG